MASERSVDQVDIGPQCIRHARSAFRSGLGDPTLPQRGRSCDGGRAFQGRRAGPPAQPRRTATSSPTIAGRRPAVLRPDPHPVSRSARSTPLRYRASGPGRQPATSGAQVPTKPSIAHVSAPSSATRPGDQPGRRRTAAASRRESAAASSRSQAGRADRHRGRSGARRRCAQQIARSVGAGEHQHAVQAGIDRAADVGVQPIADEDRSLAPKPLDRVVEQGTVRLASDLRVGDRPPAGPPRPRRRSPGPVRDPSDGSGRCSWPPSAPRAGWRWPPR